jgi:ketosteroid isomerase-like protein
MPFTVTELADIEEIRQLSYTYTLGIDTADADLLVSTFADDAVFDMSGTGQPTLVGTEQIRDFFANQQFPAMSGQIHLATNHRVVLDGDTATGTVYYLVHGIAKDRRTIFAAGYHTDQYVRTEAGWRFSSRRAESFFTPELAAIGGHGAQRD